MIKCYIVPEIWRMTDIITFYFGSFFALLSHEQAKKTKFLKNEKNSGNIVI